MHVQRGWALRRSRQRSKDTHRCLVCRKADTAARLCDEVLPRVRVRQWVQSLPYEIRHRLAWDGTLISAVLAVFQRVVHGWYRHQAKARGFADGRCGAVTFVPRFGSALNFNQYLHMLMLDGVYIVRGDGAPRFMPAPRLTDAGVQEYVIGRSVKNKP